MKSIKYMYILFGILIALIIWSSKEMGFSSVKSENYFSDSKVIDLVDAIQTANLKKIQTLTDQGVSINSVGKDGFNRPIHFVLTSGKFKVVELVLKLGADPNAKTKSNNTILRFAVQKPMKEIVGLLLENGADPNASGEANKSIIHSALSGEQSPEMIALLKKYGADLNKVWGGYPPISAAIVQQDWQAAAELMKYDIDLSIKTLQDETPAEIFCRTNQKMKPGPNSKYIIQVAHLFKEKGINMDCFNESLWKN